MAGGDRPAPAELSKEQATARLQLLQRTRARAAAVKAEVILRLAALCPDDEDPPADHPRARQGSWRSGPEVRDRRRRFPHSGQRVGWADLDHVLPHARGWRFVLDPDGTLHVTTPSGITRTTRPPGLHRTDPEPPPATEAETSTGPLPDDDPPPF